MCSDSILTSHLHRSAVSHCCNYTTALIVSTCVHMQISIYMQISMLYVSTIYLRMLPCEYFTCTCHIHVHSVQSLNLLYSQYV